MTTVERLRELFHVREDGQLIRNINQGKARAGAVAGNPHNAGYLRVTVDGKYWLAHRVVWAIVHGTLAPGEVDHKNGNRRDNRPENLRLASRADQLCNTARMRNNKSGTKGIWYDARRSRWRARVNVNGTEHQSYHDCEAEAIDWLNRTRQELHGEFACMGERND